MEDLQEEIHRGVAEDAEKLIRNIATDERSDEHR
jgi:hypothetical protein